MQWNCFGTFLRSAVLLAAGLFLAHRHRLISRGKSEQPGLAHSARLHRHYRSGHTCVLQKGNDHGSVLMLVRMYCECCPALPCLPSRALPCPACPSPESGSRTEPEAKANTCKSGDHISKASKQIKLHSACSAVDRLHVKCRAGFCKLAEHAPPDNHVIAKWLADD